MLTIVNSFLMPRLIHKEKYKVHTKNNDISICFKINSCFQVINSMSENKHTN